MSGFDVDPDSIYKASAAIESAADELDNILTDFVNQLSGVGDPWGTDTLGSLIGGGYTAIEDLAIKTYTSVVEGFDGFVDGSPTWRTHTAAPNRRRAPTSTPSASRCRRMGLQLPGALVTLLQDLGYNWPEADEEKLFDLGSMWMDFAPGCNRWPTRSSPARSASGPTTTAMPSKRSRRSGPQAMRRSRP